mgnify:CR=1 FL=1
MEGLIFEICTYQSEWEVLTFDFCTYQKALVFEHFKNIPIKRLELLTPVQLGAWFPRWSFSEVELTLSYYA